MPSPFPGMDPWIEGQDWEDFHGRFIQDLSDAVVPRVRPKYVVRVERRIYVEHLRDGPAKSIRADVAVLRQNDSERIPTGSSTTAAVAPVECTLPMPEEVHESFLTIRERQSLEVVTVVEVLSPGNKSPGSDGRREYLSKRGSVLQSSANLVELDLLRGGRRLPTLDSLPPGDYFAFVCRARRRPRAEVYGWSLRHPLPSVPLPLRGDDADVVVDLQSVFTSSYDRAGYDYSLDYDARVEPPLDQAEADWAREILRNISA